MLFNSFEFFIFFPVVVATLFAIPSRWKVSWLLGASCVFYMAFIPAYVLILFFTIAVDYWAGIAIGRSTGSRRKLYLWISIAVNVGFLAFFKYVVFFANSTNTLLSLAGLPPDIPLLRIILPIGLSFHTFQAMSYAIEVYRGNFPPEKNIIALGLYVMFFPQLVAGPIERPEHLLPQLKSFGLFSPADACAGLRLMLWGFIKKIVVADRLAYYVNEVYLQPLSHTPAANLIATVFFAFQIYCDFSGYSDIAIGAARVMGVRLVTNFREPYFAVSLSDFWHRWHISLSTWFRDYVYIPLGGNRMGWLRSQVNLLGVFLLSGLWHGASWTFVIWGAVHGTALIIERMLGDLARRFRAPTLPKLVRIAATFMVVTLAWVFFRAENVATAFTILGRIFSFSWPPRGILAPFAGIAGLPEFLLMLSGIALVITGDWVGGAAGSFPEFVSRQRKPVRWAIYYSSTAALLLLGAWGKREFIYFQF